MREGILIVLSLASIACESAAPTSPDAQTTSVAPQPPLFTTLVFSKTEGFRHDSIPAGIAAIRRQGEQRGFAVDATEDGTAFSDDTLGRYRAIVFLSTTGDVLNDAQQGAFERYIRRGGGFVGIHSAADTEYDWPFYGAMLAAYFAGHPDVQNATVRVQLPSHASMMGLPASWVRRDEWYNFQKNPRGAVDVLATLDETTYSGGTMGTDHPIAWAHDYQGGRAWYTAGGHTSESFSEPLFAGHIGAGIVWAASSSGRPP